MSISKNALFKLNLIFSRYLLLCTCFEPEGLSSGRKLY